MAKSNRGGKRSKKDEGGLSKQAEINKYYNNVYTDDTTPLMNVNYNDFMQMSDDEKADVIENLMTHSVPNHLADNYYQRFIYNMNLNDKPTLVDDATLDSISGEEMWRTVNSVRDSVHDINYDADEIIRQVQVGSITRVSDNGGSAYGRGIYFATDKSDASIYGNVRGNVKKTAQVRAKISSNAKVIDFYDAMKLDGNGKVSQKLANVMGKIPKWDSISIMALAKGYDAIKVDFGNSNSYYTVLNRKALIMSKSINSI